jgi:hypothetical protein
MNLDQRRQQPSSLAETVYELASFRCKRTERDSFMDLLHFAAREQRGTMGLAEEIGDIADNYSVTTGR